MSEAGPPAAAPVFEIEFAYSREEFVRLVHAIQPASGSRRQRVLVFFALGLFWFLVLCATPFLSLRDVVNAPLRAWSMLLFLAICTVLITFGPAIRRHRFGKIYDSRPAIRAKSRFTFSESGVATTTELVSSTFAWAYFQELIEFPSFYFLTYAKNSGYGIPKHAVPEGPRRDAWLGFVRAHLPRPGGAR